MAETSQFIAPPLIKRFSHAAAGHEGVLRDESGALIIKPCLPKEVAFYQASAAHPAFARWMPTFMGTLQLTPQDPSTAPALPSASDAAPKKPLETSIVLSNLTFGFTKPCVMDVKLGAQLWDDDAPLDKRARLDAVSDVTTSRPLGMRIAGMKVWKGATKSDYQIYDKNYGRTFSADSVIDGFKEFLFSGDIDDAHAKMIAGRFAAKVEEVLAVLENQESRMFSASLLFVYEGDPDALEHTLLIEKERKPAKDPLAEGEQEEDDDDEDEDEDDEQAAAKAKKAEDLKLIDFAHADWTPGQGPDLNSIHGVKSVLSLFKQLAA
ncbi:hypothetical protein DRE_07707 [Drechslerella stenobrocha 248]|uniref:Kinase n=1 Tax=Drechslerella stenobrocha 248 TaxID=1043628 RepID=W7HHP3_9PEZI|nr:hypothetical protein DRE_07707 [Drechslerella stenobrocha 248]